MDDDQVEDGVPDDANARSGPPRRWPGARQAARAPELRPGLQRLHETIHAFSVAERRLMWRYNREREGFSYRRLWALGFIKAEGSVTHGQLVAQTDLNPASVTVMFDRLQDEGLIRRRRDERDGRVWWISLTEDGEREVDEVHAVWTRRLAEAFAETSDADLDAASGVIERFAALFDLVGR